MDIAKIEKAISSIKKEDRPVGSFTIRELADELAQALPTTRTSIRELIKAGKAEFIGKFAQITISGQVCRVPFYRLIKK